MAASQLRVEGKFFFQGERKIYLRGVSYGTFAPDSQGDQFPAQARVADDFAQMQAIGVNCVRVYTVPPGWLLEQAAACGHHLLVGLPWAEHVAFLDSASVRREVRRAVAAGARACAGRGTSLTLLAGNEVPADIVHWLGPRRVERFLAELADSIRQACPGALVTYANFPSTEFLNLDFVDFYAFNVYLHRQNDFRRYIARLHNIAHAKPLVLSEFGADSMREGEQEQAHILDSKLAVSQEMGAAGTVVFAWTDEWFTGGHPITDWAFGVVTADRQPKDAAAVLARHYGPEAPWPLTHWPLVSVVVCAYNAERTMASCLASLQRLNYPSFELIVVDDGSTDATARICADYPFIRLIQQANQGLSAARNVGLAAANGAIVAYTDSDCDVDPDWLTYLVVTLETTAAVAAGGPNYPPPEDALVPSCVAVSPGGPTHVLLDDAVAEHIAGCNMAFRRDLLRSIGGFDAQFRAAGDDIDICWRLQDLGYSIAFSPAAMVWHHRRCRVRDYFSQQRGYGRAEARVFFKHPGRFNRMGQASWSGRIYGGALSSLVPARPFIYRGLFGMAPFQLLYQGPAPLWGQLPLTLEWIALWSVLAVLLALEGWSLLWALLPLGLSLLVALVGAWTVPLDPRFRSLRARLLVAWLLLLGPLLRSWERYRWRWILANAASPEAAAAPLRSRQAWWSEAWIERHELLQAVLAQLRRRGRPVALQQGWNGWDFELLHGLWGGLQLRSCAENHGGGKRLLRLRWRLRPAPLGVAVVLVPALLAMALLALGQGWPALSAGLLALLLGLRVSVDLRRLSRDLGDSCQQACTDLGLVPVREERRQQPPADQPPERPNDR